MRAYEVYKTLEVNTIEGRETIYQSVGIFERPEDANAFVERHPGTFVQERTLVLISEFDADNDLGVSSRTWDSKNSVSELTIREIADIKREYDMDPHEFFETRKLARELEEHIGYENFSGSKLFFDIARIDGITECRSLGYQKLEGDTVQQYEITFESGNGIIIVKPYGETYKYPAEPEEYSKNKGSISTYEVIPFRIVDGEKILDENKASFAPDYSEPHKTMVTFIENVASGEYFKQVEARNAAINEACSFFEEIKDINKILANAESFQTHGNVLEINFEKGMSVIISKNDSETEAGKVTEYQLHAFARLEDGTKQELPNISFDFKCIDGRIDPSIAPVFQDVDNLSHSLRVLEGINSSKITIEPDSHIATSEQFPLSLRDTFRQMMDIRTDEITNSIESTAEKNNIYEELREHIGYNSTEVESALKHISDKDDIVVISYDEDEQNHRIANIYFENGIVMSVNQQYESNATTTESGILYEVYISTIDSEGKEILLETTQVSKQDIENGSLSEYIDKVSSEEYRVEIDASLSSENDDSAEDGFGL